MARNGEAGLQLRCCRLVQPRGRLVHRCRCLLTRRTLCRTAGTDFEKRILANEANNQKFNFLKDGDPYNAYYRKRVGAEWCLLLAPSAIIAWCCCVRQGPVQAPATCLACS